MQDIFLTVVNMNVTALYIIAAVILLRLCLKKLPKRFSYALWAIPALRLVCPFSVEAFFSLFNFLKPAKTAESQLTYIPHNIGLMEKPEISTGIPALNRVINESLPAPAPAQSVNPMQVWVLVGTIVWLVGVAAMLLWLFASYFSVAVRVRGSKQTSEGLYICDKIDAPFVFGVIKPKIYIPADLPEKELKYIVAHEKAHIRRGDHIVKLIGAVILAVHWFNPGVWLAYKLMTKDMELSCDERALKGFETDVRKEYASALLAVSMKQNHLSRGGLLSFGESGIKSRIKSVLSFKKPALWVTVIAVAVLLVAGGCMLTNPVSGGEEADTEENREGLPALDLAAFEIIEREFYGEWQRTDNPDIVIPITYSNCFLNFENSGIQSVYETEDDFIFVYISGGEQGSFIKPKNEPDTIYSGSHYFATASEKSSASEDIFHSGVSYKRISKGSTELSEGELSLLGLCKLEFTLGAGFAECFNSIPRNECTAAGMTWVYVPGGSLSLPQQKIYLAGLSEYEAELGLRYLNKEQSEQHFAYFDLSVTEMMKTEQITPEEMYFTVHFAKSGSKWIYDGITGVYGADNIDVGVEDNGEYVEIEIEDETRETEAPLYESFNGNLLTVEKVKELSKKGSGLDWADFEGYEGFSCGSGLYIV
ncbi:MAG: M56 family metallopeptidase, partial [Ruminiclostridium sp.]